MKETKKRQFLLAPTLVALAATLVILLWIAGTARAARPAQAPAITGISPSSAPNDLDTQLTITSTGFVDEPAVVLGTTVLDDVG